jgi:hypothetical protein
MRNICLGGIYYLPPEYRILTNNCLTSRISTTSHCLGPLITILPIRFNGTDQQYCIVQYSVVQYCVVQYYVVQYCVVQYCVVQYCVVQYCVVQYCVVQYCVVQYCVVQYCVVQYCVVQYCVVQYCVVQYCVVQYCVVQLCEKKKRWPTRYSYALSTDIDSLQYSTVVQYQYLTVYASRGHSPRALGSLSPSTESQGS